MEWEGPERGRGWATKYLSMAKTGSTSAWKPLTFILKFIGETIKHHVSHETGKHKCKQKILRTQDMSIPLIYLPLCFTSGLNNIFLVLSICFFSSEKALDCWASANTPMSLRRLSIRYNNSGFSLECSNLRGLIRILGGLTS